MNKLSYALGLGIGRQLAQMGAEDLNIDDFSQAIKDILTGKEPQVSDQEAQKLVTTFFEEQEAKQRAAAAEKYKDNKEKGEAWLANKAMEEGVVALPSGLLYQVLNEGSGKKPTAADTVECHYEGRLIDGTVFDSSYKRNPNTTTFRPDQVIKGWTEALTMMPQGSTWELYIPQDLAYGSRAAGNIKPYSTLIFKVELVKIDRKQETPAKDVKDKKQTASKKKVAAKKTSKKK